MIKHIIISILFYSLLLSPTLSYAGIFDDIKSDFPYLRLDLKFFKNKDENNQKDKEYEFDDELFPKLDVLSGSDITKGSAPEDLQGNVSITIDKQNIVLSDVPKAVWFARYVRDIAQQGIISGYRNSSGEPTGLFGPSDNVTIEQLAKIALEATGINRKECRGSIKNKTAKGRWSEKYILCVESLGWAVFSDGSVNVTRPALRNEVIVTILQAFNVKFKELTGTVFTDVSASVEFANAIETAARDGLVSGYIDKNGNPTGKFGPSEPVTRAEIAKIVSVGMKIY